LPRKRKVAEDTPAGNALNEDEGFLLRDPELSHGVWVDDYSLFLAFGRVDVGLKQGPKCLDEVVRARWVYVIDISTRSGDPAYWLHARYLRGDEEGHGLGLILVEERNLRLTEVLPC
jgi:hypothetical protein